MHTREALPKNPQKTGCMTNRKTPTTETKIWKHDWGNKGEINGKLEA